MKFFTIATSLLLLGCSDQNFAKSADVTSTSSESSASQPVIDPKICIMMGDGPAQQVCLVSVLADRDGIQTTGDWFWKKRKSELDNTFRNFAFTLPHDHDAATTSSNAPNLSVICSNNGLKVGFAVTAGNARQISEVTYRVGNGPVLKKQIQLNPDGLVAFSDRDALSFIQSITSNERLIAKLNNDKHGEMKFKMSETEKVLSEIMAPCISTTR